MRGRVGCGERQVLLHTHRRTPLTPLAHPPCPTHEHTCGGVEAERKCCLIIRHICLALSYKEDATSRRG
eukprot:3041261-Rhodomonas_salina.2